MHGDIIIPTKKHVLEISRVVKRPVFFISFFKFPISNEVSCRSLFDFENWTLPQTNQSFWQERILEA